jgi:hypothetical protein
MWERNERVITSPRLFTEELDGEDYKIMVDDSFLVVTVAYIHIRNMNRRDFVGNEVPVYLTRKERAG